MAWLLSWAIKPKTVVKLGAGLGLEHPGTRLTAVLPAEIAEALTER